MKRKKSKKKEDSAKVPDNNPFIEGSSGQLKHSHLVYKGPFGNFDSAWFETEIRPLLEDKETLNYFLNAPDRKRCKELMMQAPADAVPDEEVFEFLKLSPAEVSMFLGARFVREKVRTWKEDLSSKDSERRIKAQDNLKRIGESLAYMGWDKQGITEPTFLAAQWDDVYGQLKNEGFSKQSRNLHHRRMRIQELFGIEVTASEESIIKGPLHEIADFVIAKIFGLSRLTVNQYRKRVKRIELSDGVVYILKKSQ